MRPCVRPSSQSGLRQKVGCVQKLEDRMRFIQSNQNLTRAVTTVNGVQSLLRLQLCCQVLLLLPLALVRSCRRGEYRMAGERERFCMRCPPGILFIFIAFGSILLGLSYTVLGGPIFPAGVIVLCLFQHCIIGSFSSGVFIPSV